MLNGPNGEMRRRDADVFGDGFPRFASSKEVVTELDFRWVRWMLIEVVKAFEKASGRKISYKIVPRRAVSLVSQGREIGAWPPRWRQHSRPASNSSAAASMPPSNPMRLLTW